MSATATDTYPIKKGDFIQTDDHFGDVFFEVQEVLPSCELVFWYRYSKADKKITTSTAAAERIRRFVPAEMSVPVMLKKRQRFHTSEGVYDPFDGFTKAH